MTIELDLENILFTKKGIDIFLKIQNNKPRNTDLQRIIKLSNYILNKYLNKMIDAGIIEKCSFRKQSVKSSRHQIKEKRYRLTEKGKQLIEPIRNLRIAMQKLKEEIKKL